MAYVHVAHDCQLGSHLILANAVQLAGHVHLGDWVFLGGALFLGRGHGRKDLRRLPHDADAVG